MMDNAMEVIGSNTLIDIIGHADGVPAKVDTGADSSAVWASNIMVDPKGMLHFTLFDESSTHYTGEVITRKDYGTVAVRSSNGQSEVRYRTHFAIMLGGKRIKVLCNLSNRSRNQFPVLIGRRTLVKKFLVNVTKREITPKLSKDTIKVKKEFAKDRYRFFKKHHKNIT